MYRFKTSQVGLPKVKVWHKPEILGSTAIPSTVAVGPNPRRLPAGVTLKGLGCAGVSMRCSASAERLMAIDSIAASVRQKDRRCSGSEAPGSPLRARKLGLLCPCPVQRPDAPQWGFPETKRPGNCVGHRSGLEAAFWHEEHAERDQLQDQAGCHGRLVRFGWVVSGACGPLGDDETGKALETECRAHVEDAEGSIGAPGDLLGEVRELPVRRAPSRA
jgi:hypothetical protein